MATADFVSIGVGLVVLAYVGYSFINQRVWIRKEFSWGTRDEYPKTFIINIVIGMLVGAWLIVSRLVF